MTYDELNRKCAELCGWKDEGDFWERDGRIEWAVPEYTTRPDLLWELVNRFCDADYCVHFDYDYDSCDERFEYVRAESAYGKPTVSELSDDRGYNLVACFVKLFGKSNQR